MEEVKKFIFIMDSANMMALVGIYVVRILDEQVTEERGWRV